MNRQKYLPALAEAKHEIDLSKDYFTQPLWVSGVVAGLAKKYGYRKPKNANGSTARYFYALLQRVNAPEPTAQ